MMKRLLTTICLSAVCLSAGCSFETAKSETGNASRQANSSIKQESKNYREPRRLANLQDDAITESSGIAASRANPGVFWTHNDSGDGAFLYAFDKTGKKLGVWKIENAKNEDWEDIAAYTDNRTGENYLLVGDIGNNNLSRSEAVIYKIIEPKISGSDAVSTRKNPRVTAGAQKIIVSYPDARHDAETLLVNPKTGDLYILSKNFVAASDIYKLRAPYEFDKKQILEHIGQLSVPSLTKGLLTGGDISSDGSRMILSDYFAGYEYVLPSDAKNFDEIWKTKADKIDLGERAQGEGVCYSLDGAAIYSTSEKNPSPLNETVRK